MANGRLGRNPFQKPSHATIIASGGSPERPAPFAEKSTRFETARSEHSEFHPLIQWAMIDFPAEARLLTLKVALLFT